MHFKGTLIITDPCYLMKNNEDWDKCDMGDNMAALGLSNILVKPTIYGDWSCTTYKCDTPEVVIAELCSLINKYEAARKEYGIDSIQCNVFGKKIDTAFESLEEIGVFCADAGLVCVATLEDILVYNPDFQKWTDEHNWCVTTIPDFDGNIEYIVDSNGNAHIIGDGFITIQTGY